MLTSLGLKNFRGFALLDLPRLARINLIGGVNNAGKTAILEAIFLLIERDLQRINALPRIFRAASGINEILYFWDWLVSKGDQDSGTTIFAQLEGIGPAMVEFTKSPLSPNSPLKMQFANFEGWKLRTHSSSAKSNPLWPRVAAFSTDPTVPIEDAQIYISAVKKSDNEERLEMLLDKIDPRLQRVRVYPDERTSKPMLHVGLKGGHQALPATQLGQGFNRLLRIYSSLLAEEATVFLIDEIEIGLHHSVLQTVWKGLAAVARQENVQVFATTHSREAILAAHRVFSDEPEYDFAYHRLERDAKGEIRVVTYDQEALAGADEANFEIR